MEHEKDGTFQSNVCEIMAICSQSGFDLCTPARRAGRANYYYFCMDSINYILLVFLASALDGTQSTSRSYKLGCTGILRRLVVDILPSCLPDGLHYVIVSFLAV